MTSTLDIADFMPYRLGTAWSLVNRSTGAECYALAIKHLDHERMRRTVGSFPAYPLPLDILQLGEREIAEALPNRHDALRAILWAASNADPTDVIFAIDHVQALLEDCNP